MKRALYIVCPSGDPDGMPWKLVVHDEVTHEDARALFATQQLAIDAAVTICRSRLRNFGLLSELQIHGRNGRIWKGASGRRTYGRDPREVKG